MYLKAKPHSAFLLHARPYRSTSVIARFFTYESGSISAVVRGVRGKGARKAGVLQLFTPLAIIWTGNTELKTITHFEEAGRASALEGGFLHSGIYINELLYRLLHDGEALAMLFGSYCESLHLLEAKKNIEPILRRFEKNLLSQLGYGVSYEFDAQSGDAIQAESYYSFTSDVGFVKEENLNAEKFKNVFSGSSILAIADEDFSHKETLQDAKRIMRQSITIHLNGKPLQSRSLFLKHKKEVS